MKYQVFVVQTESTYVVVEAASPDAAENAVRQMMADGQVEFCGGDCTFEAEEEEPDDDDDRGNVLFQGRTYPTRTLHVASWGDVTVSTESLAKVLMDDDGGFVSEDAEKLDEGIFYYVGDAQISLPAPELADMLLKTVD